MHVNGKERKLSVEIEVETSRQRLKTSRNYLQKAHLDVMLHFIAAYSKEVHTVFLILQVVL